MDVDTFLRYGLFLGAIFQLVCIGAVIVMPDNAPDTAYHQESEVDESDEELTSSDGSSPQISPRHGFKKDKKKRR